MGRLEVCETLLDDLFSTVTNPRVKFPIIVVSLQVGLSLISAWHHPDLCLECPKRAFTLRLGRIFLENFNVFFTTKNLQLVYPPLWRGPFNENPYTKLRLGRSKSLTTDRLRKLRKASRENLIEYPRKPTS